MAKRLTGLRRTEAADVLGAYAREGRRGSWWPMVAGLALCVLLGVIPLLVR
jgi:hypothetical protein